MNYNASFGEFLSVYIIMRLCIGVFTFYKDVLTNVYHYIYTYVYLYECVNLFSHCVNCTRKYSMPLSEFTNIAINLINKIVVFNVINKEDNSEQTDRKLTSSHY